MRRRTGWMIGSAVAVVVFAGAALVLWPGGSAPPPAAPSPEPVATTPAPPAERAQEELDDVLTACAESTASTPPEHCGIRIPWGTEFAAVTGIRYRAEALPVLVLDGDSFTAGGGVLIATVTGTGLDGAPRTETYRTENWAVRGDVMIAGEEVELSVW